VVGALAAWGFRLFPDQDAFGENLGAGLVGILATVLILDRLSKHGSDVMLRESLVYQFGSPSSATATEAARLLRLHAWHRDGSLQGANLVGADLSGADLYDFDLRSANLYHAKLAGCDLYGARLEGASLRSADLTDATLHAASLRGANLEGAVFDRARLAGADFTDAILDNASWVGATTTDPIVDGLPPAMFGPRSTGQPSQAQLALTSPSGAHFAPSTITPEVSLRTSTALVSGANALSAMSIDESLLEMLQAISGLVFQDGSIDPPPRRLVPFVFLFDREAVQRAVAMTGAETDEISRAFGGRRLADLGPLATGEDAPVTRVWRRSESGLASDRVFEWTNSAISAPILVGHANLGSFVLVCSVEDAFSPDDVALVEVFAQLAATALTRTRFQNITVELFKQGSKKALLDTVLQEAALLLQVHQGGFYEYKPDREQLELVWELGQPAAFGNTLEVGEGLAGSLVAQGLADRSIKHMIVEEYSTWAGRSDLYPTTRQYDAVLGVLLRRRNGTIIGSFSLDCEVQRGWTEADANLLKSFAEYVELAYEQLDSIDQLQRLRDVARSISEYQYRGEAWEDVLREIATRISTAVEQDIVELVVVREVNDKRPASAHWLSCESVNDFAHIESVDVKELSLEQSVVFDIGWTEIRTYESLAEIPFQLSDAPLELRLSQLALSKIALAPLRTVRGPIGMLLVAARTGHAEIDLNVLQAILLLAGQTAGAIGRLMEVTANRKYLENAAHQLRGPVEIAKGVIDLLAGGIHMTEAELHRQLTQASDSLDQQEGLIRSFLDLGLIDEGLLLMSSNVIDVRALVDRACELTVPLAKSRDVDVVPGADVGGVIEVRGDRERLQQAVINLLTNAAQASSPGMQVHVGCELRGNEVHIVVSDTGGGISDGDQAHLFERYFRGKDEEGGAGLGLYLAREWVARHGGSLEVSSTVGVGSTFTIALPVTQEGSAAIVP
jgi:signal transduction histidine kinase/GAF domain-containing protein